MNDDRHSDPTIARYDSGVIVRAHRSAPLLLVALAVLLGGCMGSGEIPTRISGQIVGSNEEGLGPGLVMIEWGPVHDGAYQLGGHIDESGRFSIDLPRGGTWGLHLFVDDYQYVPVEIEIMEHQQIVLTNPMVAWGVWMDLTGQHSWPTQPDDSTLTRMPEDETTEDNPVLESVTLAWEGDLLHVAADVSDPDDDLSRMVLMWDETTGAGSALEKPGPPDDQNNYPQGIWETSFFADFDDDDGDDDLHIPGESELHFVVSDNLCNDTQILKMPIPDR